MKPFGEYKGAPDLPLEAPMLSPDDLIGSGALKATIAGLKGLPLAGLAIKNLYHGGTYIPGTPIKDVLYAAEDPKMAETFVDMYNDRFGGLGANLPNYGEPASLKQFHVDIEPHHAAPMEVVKHHAEKAGIPFEDYTPASAFDANLHGAEPVRKLISALRNKGYTHTVLEDVPYGDPMGHLSMDANAHVLFPDVVTKLRNKP
jgi:hypothetical protein